jgi:uncharacterized protein (DUF1684 family)
MRCIAFKLAHVGEVHRRAGLELWPHQSSHRLTARTITMSAASITNPTNTSNGVAVIIAHLAHVADRHRQTGQMFGFI